MTTTVALVLLVALVVGLVVVAVAGWVVAWLCACDRAVAQADVAAADRNNADLLADLDAHQRGALVLAEQVSQLQQELITAGIRSAADGEARDRLWSRITTNATADLPRHFQEPTC